MKKFFKTLVITLLILISIPLILALFIEGKYQVERKITIQENHQVLFDYMKSLKNQTEYAVWQLRDPKTKHTYTGEDGTVGFIAAWESKDDEVGVGEQEIVSLYDGKRIETKLRFKVPFEAEDDAYLETIAIDTNQTLVKWGFSGEMPYPFNVMMLFMDMDEMVGKDLEIGLKNLKKISESAKN